MKLLIRARVRRGEAWNYWFDPPDYWRWTARRHEAQPATKCQADVACHVVEKNYRVEVNDGSGWRKVVRT